MAAQMGNREAVRIIENLCRYGYQASAKSDFQGRVHRNILGKDRRSTKADAWDAVLIAILTTQQPSGPGSRPAQVLHSRALTWRKVTRNPRIIAQEIRGFRFNDTKRQRLRVAHTWLDKNWLAVKSFQTALNAIGPDDPDRYDVECEAAGLLLGRSGGIPGIGPKQARNFWQWLGYTVWTIPLDSRIQKILRAPPFLLSQASKGLSDFAYSEVEHQVGNLCRAAKMNVYPVLLDSALFNMEGLIRDLAGFPAPNPHGF